MKVPNIPTTADIVIGAVLKGIIILCVAKLLIGGEYV